MKEIIFVTTNQGKVQSLQQLLPKSRLTVIQQAISLPELQGNSAKEIAEEKAKAAYKILQKPLIIQDSGFHINALHGFPGAYIKYIQETIKLEGLMKLMKGVEDRTCYFEQALTYIDEGGTKTFDSDRMMGTFALKIEKTNSSRAWGIIWKAFIPQGFDKTLSVMTKDELAEIDNKNGGKSEFTYFAEWITK